MPVSPADPGSAGAATPVALEELGLLSPCRGSWLMVGQIYSSSSGSPHLKSKCRFQIQFCPLVEQLLVPSVT